MNPGNAGVHVSLLRKEINETNRERRRYSYDRKCSKLESFYKEAPGSRFTVEALFFLSCLG